MTRQRTGRKRSSASGEAPNRATRPSGSRPQDSGKPSERESLSKPAPACPEPGLYLTATPIGNARDITLRALDLLEAADVIACEDTRKTRSLLALHGLKTPLAPYHEHNARAARPKLLRRLAQGEVVCLVSDAGTPLVSDPGYKLVRAAIEAGHRVTALPGASAPLAALSIAGLPTDRFLVVGFLPTRAAARRKDLAALAGVRASLVVFEAARRLPETLTDMAETLGPREACVARELTKRYEEARRGPLDALAAAYAEDGPPRGEVVVVIGPPTAGDRGATDPEALDGALRAALATHRLKDAVDAVAGATGEPRRRVYRRALALAGKAADSS